MLMAGTAILPHIELQRRSVIQEDESALKGQKGFSPLVGFNAFDLAGPQDPQRTIKTLVLKNVNPFTMAFYIIIGY